jgi:hypothetical protein
LHAWTFLRQQAVLEEEERRKQAEEAQKESERQAEAEHKQRLARLKQLAEVAAADVKLRAVLRDPTATVREGLCG